MIGDEPQEGVSPEQEGKEPTLEEIVEACKDDLSPEAVADLQEMQGSSLEEIVGNLFGLLIESGIDDPTGYLTEKGILE